MADEERIESQEEVQVSADDEHVEAASEEAPAEQPAEEPAEEPSAEAPAEEQTRAEVEKVVNESDMSEADAEAAMMAMLEDLPQEEQKASADDIDFSSTEVSKAEFQHLSEPASTPEPRNIDLLMDVNLPIAIELGRTRMSIAEILALGPGSVVELNKLAGEPVDVLVNQKIVARGEVVVIDENFGVRITQLMTPQERLKLLSDEQ